MARRSSSGRSARGRSQPSLPLGGIEVRSMEAGPDLPSLHTILGPTREAVMEVGGKLQAQLEATHNVEFGGETERCSLQGPRWGLPVYVKPKHRGRGRAPKWFPWG